MIKKIISLIVLLIVLVPSSFALSFDGGIFGLFDAISQAQKIDMSLMPPTILCNDQAPGIEHDICKTAQKKQSEAFSELNIKVAWEYTRQYDLYLEKQAINKAITDAEAQRIENTKNNLREKTRDVWKYTSAILIISLDLIKSIFYISMLAFTIFAIFVFIPKMFMKFKNAVSENITVGVKKRREKRGSQ